MSESKAAADGMRSENLVFVSKKKAELIFNFMGLHNGYAAAGASVLLYGTHTHIPPCQSRKNRKERKKDIENNSNSFQFMYDGIKR